MLWLILGDYGDGKTLRLVIEAFSKIYKDREIWANFLIRDLPNYKLLRTPMDLRDIGENKLILIDEMQNWFNSHDTMSLTNEFFTDFIHDCDKMSNDVFGTSHRLMSIEIDFRNGCHRIITCERIGSRPPLRERLTDRRDFRFKTISTYDLQILEKKRLRYEKAKIYFPLFDTKQRIPRLNDKTRELRLLWKHNPPKALIISQEIAESLKPIFENGVKLTQTNLEIELANIGYGEDEKVMKKIYSLIAKLLK